MVNNHSLKPNLFLIGAMKSGTSTLHSLLAQHPEIYMSEPKEPCYFVDPEFLKKTWPEMWKLGFWKSEAAYLALFSKVDQEKVIGESSTDYSKLPDISGIPEKIFEFNSNARFIYIMRDPVERTISHYWHMTEHRGEMRPPEQAIFNNPVYTDVSYYAFQLKPYIELFGRDKIFTLTFEEYKQDTALKLKEIFAWLEVDPEFTPESLHSKVNVTPENVPRKTGRHGLEKFRYSKTWDVLSSFVPKSVRNIGVDLIEKKVNRDSVDMTQTIHQLRHIQQKQTMELSQLLGRDFKEWKTLYGDKDKNL